MATAKKLPSGSWRVRVFSHYEVKDGKKIRKYESFTSKDKTRAGKSEAERMALEWVYRRSARQRDVLLVDVVNSYINARKGVTSPSTIRAYSSYARHHLDDIGTMSINDLDMVRLQTWVSDMSMTLKPKTVNEIVSMVQSAYREKTGKSFTLTLPKEYPPDLHTPTDKEIAALMNTLPEDLKIAMLLAGFCSLRNGEICALTSDDIVGDSIVVSKIMVRDVTGDWIIKLPKEPDSVRTIPVPEKIMELIKDKKGKIVPFNPDSLSKKFGNAVKREFRLHDLRHYYASIAHYLGIPDAYIMINGGWKTESMMKRVYREAMTDKIKEENDKITKHFNRVI